MFSSCADIKRNGRQMQGMRTLQVAGGMGCLGGLIKPLNRGIEHLGHSCRVPRPMGKTSLHVGHTARIEMLEVGRPA